MAGAVRIESASLNRGARRRSVAVHPASMTLAVKKQDPTIPLLRRCKNVVGHDREAFDSDVSVAHKLLSEIATPVDL